jgi:hypothetical protein
LQYSVSANRIAREEIGGTDTTYRFEAGADVLGSFAAPSGGFYAAVAFAVRGSASLNHSGSIMIQVLVAAAVPSEPLRDNISGGMRGS